MMNSKNRTGGIDNMRTVFVLVLVSLIVMLTMPVIFTNVASADDPPYLKFKITDAGQTGTITLYYANGNKINSWEAKSGNNKPDHQYVDSVGPIPKGTWPVNRKGYLANHPTWYPVKKGGTLACTRDEIFIHGWGSTTGCIAVKNYDDFTNTVENHWPTGASTINLMVSYSDTAYECDPDPECCDNGGQNACCDEGPNKDKKDYCPATSENGCCQYGEECYDGNKDPAKCSACYGGTWHSGKVCCKTGPNKDKKCYTPRTPENGCCDHSGGSYSGKHDPEECVVCYDGKWYECCSDDDCQDGYICNLETHTCEEEVPEFPAGVTVIFGACMLMFFMMRRKYIEK